MKAMILGAGLGTRLAPLTHTLPKILVPVSGLPMLERLVAFLGQAGVDEIALNTHHLAEAVRAHLGAAAYARRVRLFHEPRLLGTGGALVNAGEFWREVPLLLWNGDILADIDLAALFEAHQSSGAMATMAVQDRGESSRLLVDGRGRVVGIDSPKRGGRRVVVDSSGDPQPLAYNGIAVLSPGLLPLIRREGAFDLVDALLEVIAAGQVVNTFDVLQGFWATTGSPEELRRLEENLERREPLLRRYTPAP